MDIQLQWRLTDPALLLSIDNNMAALPISVELMSKPIQHFLPQPSNKSPSWISLAYSTGQLETLVHPVLTGTSHIVSVLLHHGQNILHIP